MTLVMQPRSACCGYTFALNIKVASVWRRPQGTGTSWIRSRASFGLRKRPHGLARFPHIPSIFDLPGAIVGWPQSGWLLAQLRGYGWKDAWLSRSGRSDWRHVAEATPSPPFRLTSFPMKRGELPTPAFLLFYPGHWATKRFRFGHMIQLHRLTNRQFESGQSIGS